MSKFLKWRTLAWVVVFLGLWAFASWWHLQDATTVHELPELDQEFSKRPYATWNKYVGKTLRVAGRGVISVSKNENGKMSALVTFPHKKECLGLVGLESISEEDVAKHRSDGIVVIEGQVRGWVYEVGLTMDNAKLVKILTPR